MRSTLLIILLIAACRGGTGGGDDSPDALPGGACGGRGTGACAADQFCDFGTNRCGTTDEVGTCRQRPTACPLPLVPEPTCGCDGKVYVSQCAANEAGADLNAAGSCPLGANAFACGYRQCATTQTYCQRTTSDIGGEGDAFTCRPLPVCPATPNCACLAGEPCGSMCTGQGATGLTVTCPGG
jgi:hypothetical protein